MKHVVIFGPTKNVLDGKYSKLVDLLDAYERPFVIVTSTCSSGWDAMGRRYANEHSMVFSLVIKAPIKQFGYERAVQMCNDWMLEEADEGITQEGVDTPVSLDMVKKLKDAGKMITYL